MSGQSRWWAIPGALLVLTGVLAFGDSQPSQRPAPESPSAPVAPAAQPSDGIDIVMARDASGRRQPLAFGPVSQALILQLPEHFAGKNVHVTLWRRLDGSRESTPWIDMEPKVRGDATLPMAGIVPGSYDIQVGLPGEPQLLVEAAAAPGEVRFGAATPVR